MPDADHRLFIVWTNTFPRDGEEAARAATAIFDDPRVEQFHDPERAVGRAVAPAIGMPSLRRVAEGMGTDVKALRGRFRDSYLLGDAAVFDTMFFFPPGVEWDAAPPADAGWVTQLDPGTFLLDKGRFFWGNAMGDEMARLAKLAQPPAITPGTRIWDAAPHNAFGDLVRFGERFYATHREADEHVGGTDGLVRILASDDGATWSSVALLAEPGIDLRDPKLSVTPQNELLVTCGGVDYSDGLVERHTRAALSDDGAAFGPLRRVAGIPTSNWFFRLAWNGDVGYCMPNLWDADPATGKIDGDTRRIALFKTTDGLSYERVGADLPLPRGACEASLAFEPDGTMVAVLRDAFDAEHAWLVRTAAPYESFAVTEIAHGLGGPHLVRLDDGTLLVGTREWPHDSQGRADGVDDHATVVLRLHADGTFERVARLASGGDTGYPGLVVHAGELWVQYYSSHGGGTAIYLARVALDAPR